MGEILGYAMLIIAAIALSVGTYKLLDRLFER
jgi:hypothetical protein